MGGTVVCVHVKDGGGGGGGGGWGGWPGAFPSAMKGSGLEPAGYPYVYSSTGAPSVHAYHTCPDTLMLGTETALAASMWSSMFGRGLLWVWGFSQHAESKA